MKFEDWTIKNWRKWIGFFVILSVLFAGGLKLANNGSFPTFAKYAFYSFVVFVSGNAIEHLKDIWK